MFLKKSKIELPYDPFLDISNQRKQDHYLKEIYIFFMLILALFTNNLRVDEQVDKENMIPTDTHKFSFSKEGNPDIYNMSELRGYYAG